MSRARYVAGGAIVAASLGAFGYIRFCREETILPQVLAGNYGPLPPPKVALKPRSEHMKSLKSEEFDILVIGGGATGTGIALDATSRGLKTALVERDDFSSGTSSRSTKLIHGGVRYLEKAVKNLDWGQYALVREALHERANLLKIAGHLSEPLPIMLPIYRWWQVPYYWAGAKFYDFVAGRKGVKSSYFLFKNQAIEKFPMLKEERLVGAMIYYDGQHNDARMNLALALTAQDHGAVVTNYTEVLKLLKEPGKQFDGKDGEVICGANIRDNETGEVFNVKAKCVINATGPFTDGIRQMDDASTKEIVQPSAGVHIVLPNYYSPENMGLLDPATSDGRVIFFLPWEGHTVAGTTDSPTTVTSLPQAKEEEISFILSEIKNYLSPDVQVRRGDVLSVWSGIRPLVRDPDSPNTESLSRNHIVNVSSSKMITVAGGKWTTYRAMAKDAVDKAIDVFKLKPTNDCITERVYLHGSHGYSGTLFIQLIQDFGLEKEVADHLAHTYGDKAVEVAKMAAITGSYWPIVGRRLVSGYPYIEAEVLYAIKEYACTATDIVARRTRLGFLNVQAAEEALPRIIELMAKQQGWDKERQSDEMAKAKAFLATTGGEARDRARSSVRIDFSAAEMSQFRKQFDQFDTKKTGQITVQGLRKVLADLGEDVSDQHLHDLIQEVDNNQNGAIDFQEYIQLMASIKSGNISSNRLALVANRAEKGPIDISRSGGGV